MSTPVYIDGPALHPSDEHALYTVHLSSSYVHAAALTAATWTVSGGAVVSDSSYANPGSVDHTAAETRDGVDYSGPLASVWLDAGTAVEGDTIYATLEYQTDLAEGPRHVVVRIPVTVRTG